MRTSFVRESGFLEWIARRHEITLVLYRGSGKAFLTNGTSALLITNKTPFVLNSSHKRNKVFY